jgi:hypothetical protein
MMLKQGIRAKWRDWDWNDGDECEGVIVAFVGARESVVAVVQDELGRFHKAELHGLTALPALPPPVKERLPR